MEHHQQPHLLLVLYIQDLVVVLDQMAVVE
jgi:hypothetical protein